MQITYINIEQKDKNQLMKMAQLNQLSLSTLCNIIMKHYFFAVNQKEYYKKGKSYTCIKIRNEFKHDINSINITNCIYAYLHHEVLKEYPNKDFVKNANRQIANEIKNTYDPNWLKNTLKRANYKPQESRA